MRAYLPLLRVPGARAFSAAAFVGRLPIAMLGIGTVLLVEDRRDSYALAGLTSAALAIGAALGGPQVSRLIDRLGQRRVLPIALAAHAVALVGLVLTAGTGLHAAVLVVAALVAGAFVPPLGSCVRARWSTTLRTHGRGALLPTAFALESVVDELVFVLGPALVVVLAVAVDPVAGLLLSLTLATTGTLWLVAQTATEPAVEAAPATGSGAALHVPGLRTTALAMVFIGAVFGAMEVGMVAFADQRDRAAAAGVLLPLIAVGSGVSGLVYGARTWQTPLDRRFLLALAALTVGVVPLVLAPSVEAMALAALLAGVAVSPVLIASFGLVEDLVPARARTEGFTWLNSGLGAGVALGSALAGALADGPGARAAFVVCILGAAIAAASASVRRRTLRPPAVAV